VKKDLFTHDEVTSVNPDKPKADCGLLWPFIQNGKRARELPSLDQIQSFAKAELTRLGAPYKDLKKPAAYPVLFKQHVPASSINNESEQVHAPSG